MIRHFNNINLKDRNTFGIEASCSDLVEFSSIEDLKEVFSEPTSVANGWSVLSGGSNIIFKDDYKGLLLHPVGQQISVVSETEEQVIVNVQAGRDWDEFVAWTVANGLWGAENLSGIPGLTGASPVQNIGAYGVEAKDIIHSVEMFCVDSLSVLTLASEHCAFGYRSSIFKTALKNKVIITSVNFSLNRKASPCLGYGDLFNKVEDFGDPTAENIRKAVIAIRDSKLPDPKVLGNAGSFFKNPVVPQAVADQLKKEYPSMPLYPAQIAGHAKLAAGWLIDQCGWKGRNIGRVGVHEKQALVVVNLGGATGRDVLSLASMIKSDVFHKFGVEIEMEVNVL